MAFEFTTGRRLCQWLIERFRLREDIYQILDSQSNICLEYSMTAQLVEGDPAFEWVIHFLVCFNLSSEMPMSSPIVP